MTQPKKIIPFSLKDAPSLIESVLPVQKLSVDVYKERMAGSGQTLTALGSYWKGRKPLVLNRACVLSCLLPATNDPKKDLEVFELLMSMDDISLSKRFGLAKPQDILSKVILSNPWDYFEVTPLEAKNTLPKSSPFDINNYLITMENGKSQLPKIFWKSGLSDDQKHGLSALALPQKSYRQAVSDSSRAEEIFDTVHTHIWVKVNEHLGTNASSFIELTEQLGIMRFGHKPKVADTFSGSGQIPFEAARLGCDVYASDLNPIACLLTWGAFNVVGSKKTKELESEQKKIATKVQKYIDDLGVELDGSGWRGKAYLYCLEVLCPSSGWRVPVLLNRIINKNKKVIVDLVPDKANKRYDIVVKSNVSEQELKKAATGTYKYQHVFHIVDDIQHSTKISTIRGDFIDSSSLQKESKNKLRQWDISDIEYNNKDIFNERLYVIQWIRDGDSGKAETEYRSVNKNDLEREVAISKIVHENLATWQAGGLVPDMKIEPGHNTSQPIWERGWTYWHHLFNPRQLLILAKCNEELRKNPENLVIFPAILNLSSKLCGWHNDGTKGGCQNAFSNQALNTLFNYGTRGLIDVLPYIEKKITNFPLSTKAEVISQSVDQLDQVNDIYITDPPYGDAVKYEEILEYFICWLRKNPPKEFAHWVWDSRRALAIKGEDHDFKLSMVRAYKKMAECMPENGIQVVMFTHQSGTIWADMANIVWASGLHVTAAWYVVTETDSVLRDGQYVKGTILLVLRKRLENLDAARDELAYELADEVKKQVDLLTGLNKDAKDLHKDENLFEDADLQMAGYAAALRVLTRYKTIDGVDMPQESLRPRVKGQLTMVDELIDFAVNIANEYLVPEGMDTSIWEKSTGIERLYLKMLDMESKGIFTLSNYQNFAKAFKVRDDGEIMNEAKANKASLKTAKQLGKKGMNATDEFGPTILRSILYAIHILEENKTKPEDVLHQLRDLVPDYYRERNRISALAEYISKKTTTLRPEESSNAIVLRDLVRREKV